ncbi:MAG: trimethylamine methyltransferase family protein, partial [Anaerolineales bacterium]|nr:trimethylamine methyltransferase family protein [Anaerolineales bacterium]
KTPDPQAIYEKHLQTYLCATAGVNYIMPLGGLDNEGTHSPTQMVIDNEVCRMVGKVLEGIKVDQEHLAVDLIKEVGPVPGNYLKTEHTRQHWREEYIIPEVGVREEYSTWVLNGRKGVLDQAKERARHLMDTHQHNPLPNEAERELAKILIAAENEKIPS